MVRAYDGTKRITITLTGRPPVTIDPDAWPVLATGLDYEGQREADATRWDKLVVRQHADGRCLVIGFHRTRWQGEREHDAGELVAPAGDLIEAQRRVAAAIGAGEALVQDVVSALPPVELD